MSDSGEPLLSPYQRVLGAELSGLHPRLRAYFSAIPVGSVGVGEGTWDRVGSPRRWLWPVLWVLEKQGVAFPVWAEGVPFGVRNTPVGGPARPAVEAERTFRFPRAEWVMGDSIGVVGDELVDRLGPSRRYVARLRPQIVDGTLTMESTGLRIRVGRRTVPLPAAISPRVALTERFDDRVGRQHVSLTLTMPLIGRLYEYSGYFDYRILPERMR